MPQTQWQLSPAVSRFLRDFASSRPGVPRIPRKTAEASVRKMLRVTAGDQEYRSRPRAALGATDRARPTRRSLPRRGRGTFDQVTLQERQRHLLLKLVNASRRPPGAARRKFLLATGADGELLLHPGLPGGRLRLAEGDADTLAHYGLVRISRVERDTRNVLLTPIGLAYYRKLTDIRPEPVERIESGVVGLIDSDRFQRRYPEAFRRWSAAAELLSSETDADLRKIGRLCRQAMQAFTFALVKRYRPAGARSTRGDSVDQLRAVIAQQEGRLGESRTALLAALIGYWGSLADLLQLQERSAGDPAAPVTPDDAQGLVLHTLVVIGELDRSLPR